MACLAFRCFLWKTPTTYKKRCGKFYILRKGIRKDKTVCYPPYINPMDRNIEETSHSFFRILDEEYETAPANDTLQDFFMNFKGKENANHKLRWLFGHTYLIEPSVQEYIAQVTDVF